MSSYTDSITPSSDEQTPDYKPQTYEQWKAAHDWQPEAEPRLEIGQRVKATRNMSEADEWTGAWDKARKPERVPVNTEGSITDIAKEIGWYTVAFDNGITWLVEYIDPEKREDGYLGEVLPVGKSPSQLAYEQSERERLAAYQQLSLFDAAQTGGAS